MKGEDKVVKLGDIGICRGQNEKKIIKKQEKHFLDSHLNRQAV